MKVADLDAYIKEKTNAGLTGIVVTLVSDPEVTNDFYVSKTKETYSLYTEDDANKMAETLRETTGFQKISKKFKAGKKKKKTGEDITPDSWIVVGEIGWN